MSYAIVENDLITRILSGDLVAPEDAIAFDAALSFLPADRLGWDGEAVIDVATLDVFFVGGDGRKYAVSAAGRQEVECSYDAELVKDVDGWRLVNAADQVAALKASRIAVLTAACAEAIVSGYSSSALGNEHLYPSKQTDQINMMGSVTDSLLPGQAPDWTTPFWCADESGAWAFRPHTATEIQSAGADGKAHILECQTRLGQLAAQVIAAASAEAVAAIVWEE
ncbi:hypothetical protein GYN07_15375 [Rhizobium leguminosarum bv. viciae 248]|uniref:DUF4376 domain-containing protein n=1 Tax=Rhizobium leguminosarum TaxID=384 RepID=UPI00035F6BD4|nr:hypothetical protein [Rhizobium leguminosarum]QHW25635.1 hypothetical protein GYN07_15375 [Rhizobium leguminosarum bv. viciae 248]